ncbi:hypothetical protein HG530_011849 [Fusarium avenaceum]|nr:hypothetical protein HG530_011849 [Fusarium avenaceum]
MATPKNPADQPFPLIATPTSQLHNGEYPDQFHRCASEMATIHNMVLRGLNSIYLQAPHIKPADEKSFLGYSACFYDLVHVHHQGEEDILFPAIEEMSGEKGIMDQNIEQHHAFSQGLKDYNIYISACLRDTEEYNGSRLVAIIDSFGHELADHLAQEIITILNLRQYGTKMEKFEEKFKEWADKDTSNLAVPGTLTWGFFNHDKQYEDGLWQDWPPAPAPVVFSVRWKAMAESILHIEEARHYLEIFQRELKQETRSHIALDSIIVGAEDNLARTSRKLNSATRQITDMHNFQDVVKASNKDVQADMKGAIRKARHNLKRSIKTKEDADKEFQRQQEELDAYKDY